MTKEQVIQKLTSRKLWLSVIGFAVGAAMVHFGIVEEGTSLMVAALTVGIGGEALIDAARAIAQKIITTTSTNVNATTSTAKTVEKIAGVSDEPKEQGSDAR